LKKQKRRRNKRKKREIVVVIATQTYQKNRDHGRWLQGSDPQSKSDCQTDEASVYRFETRQEQWFSDWKRSLKWLKQKQKKKQFYPFG
jgi:hypothetical protein